MAEEKQTIPISHLADTIARLMPNWRPPEERPDTDQTEQDKRTA